LDSTFACGIAWPARSETAENPVINITLMSGQSNAAFCAREQKPRSRISASHFPR